METPNVIIKKPFVQVSVFRRPGQYAFVKATLREGLKACYLAGYGDLHSGSPMYDEDKARLVRDLIHDQNILWIGMGDMGECATRYSVGAGVYEQIYPIDDQTKYLTEFLMPIRHLCLGMVKGNHEERAHKAIGHDPADALAHALKVPYMYWEFFGTIVGNRVSYNVYATHSMMANKTGGLALNATERDIEKMMGNIDIIMRGHTHKRSVDIAERFDVDINNSMVKVKQRALVITGHYLKRDMSYAAAKPMRGHPPGTIVLKLHVDRHNRDRGIVPNYV